MRFSRYVGDYTEILSGTILCGGIFIVLTSQNYAYGQPAALKEIQARPSGQGIVTLIAETGSTVDKSTALRPPKNDFVPPRQQRTFARPTPNTATGTDDFPLSTQQTQPPRHITPHTPEMRVRPPPSPFSQASPYDSRRPADDGPFQADREFPPQYNRIPPPTAAFPNQDDASGDSSDDEDAFARRPARGRSPYPVICVVNDAGDYCSFPNPVPVQPGTRCHCGQIFGVTQDPVNEEQ